MSDYYLGRKHAPDERDRKFGMRLLLDPLREQYFPRGLADGTRHYRPGKVLDQGRTGTCFPAGTLVTMADGSEKPIEQIRAGEAVWTHENRGRMVRAVMARQYAGPVVRMKMRSVDTELVCTPEHPLFVSEVSLVDTRAHVLVSEGKWKKTVGTARAHYSAPVWRAASETREHVRHGTFDALILSRATVPTTLMVGEQLDILSLLPTGTSTSPDGSRVRVYGARHSKTLPRQITVTEDVAWCLGVYLAEGRSETLGGRSVAVFAGHEEDMARRYGAVIEALFGVESHIAQRPNGVWKVSSNSTTLAHLFYALGGCGSGQKRLHRSVFSWDTTLLQALWRGHKEGDGWEGVSKKTGVIRTVLTTVSPQLARDLFRIGLRLGMAPSLISSQPKVSHGVKSRRRRYDVSVYSTSRYDQGDAHTLPRAVLKRDQVSYEGLVFNIEVEEDQSYIANGFIVHNCVAHGWTSKMHAAPIMQQLPVSPYDLYRQIVQVDEWFDNDSEATAPDAGLQSGTSVRAGAKVLQAMGYLQNYLWAESVEDVRAWHLAGFGGCVIGVNWTTNMFQTDLDGFVNYTGSLQGGHCVVTTGWNDKVRHHGQLVRAMRCQNSWSTAFGEKGRFWISEGDLAKLMQDAGEVAAPTEIRVEVD